MKAAAAGLQISRKRVAIGWGFWLGIVCSRLLSLHHWESVPAFTLTGFAFMALGAAAFHLICRRAKRLPDSPPSRVILPVLVSVGHVRNVRDIANIYVMAGIAVMIAFTMAGVLLDEVTTGQLDRWGPVGAVYHSLMPLMLLGTLAMWIPVFWLGTRGGGKKSTSSPEEGAVPPGLC